MQLAMKGSMLFVVLKIDSMCSRRSERSTFRSLRFMITSLDGFRFSYFFRRAQQLTEVIVRSCGRYVVLMQSCSSERWMMPLPSILREFYISEIILIQSIIIKISVIPQFNPSYRIPASKITLNITLIVCFEDIMHDNRGTVLIGEKQVRGDHCISEILGAYIDIEWDAKSGVMRLSSTKHHSYSHSIDGHVEILNHVSLRHGSNCPLLNSQVQKNPNRPMRPCSVVLIENKDSGSFLATKRPSNISFGGKWVLPGGHLEVGEGVTEGGLRECCEEVGLKKEAVEQVGDDVMAWESVYTKDSEVKATGLVIFFRIKAKTFEIVGQEGQIEAWEWRRMEQGYPWGEGWAEGHLAYLRHINGQFV